MNGARVAFVLALAGFLTGVSDDAHAQCAMCVTALEQNGGELAAGFNRGILFLLGMPYLVFGRTGQVRPFPSAVRPENDRSYPIRLHAVQFDFARSLERYRGSDIVRR